MAERAKIIAAIAVIGYLLALGFAVHSRAAEREPGGLEIRIKDHRDAIDDFAELKITIEKILLSPDPGLKSWQTGWKELAANPETIDLSKYVGIRTARVYRGALAAGSFDAFHLKIKSVDSVLKKNQRAGLVKNTIGPVKLPFDVPPRGETLLIIDLVVTDFSDHPPRGYELGLKGYELYTGGKLIAKVPPG